MPLLDVACLIQRLLTGGVANLWQARAEVLRFLSLTGLPDAPVIADAADPKSIPSIAGGDWRDRILAEIDHDGFAFAKEAKDEPRFNKRAKLYPRAQHCLDIVLHGGRVCFRKRFRPLLWSTRRFGNRDISAAEWAHRQIWVRFGLPFYNEAASLLRLRDLDFVPHLRDLDMARQILYIDYIDGESLRHRAAKSGAPVHDLDLAGRAELSVLSPEDLHRREVGLLDQDGSCGDYRRRISAMAHAISQRGVAPLDMKLGNFLIGEKTGQIYWIDFELVRLASQPRWDKDLMLHRRILRRLFDETNLNNVGSRGAVHI